MGGGLGSEFLKSESAHALGQAPYLLLVPCVPFGSHASASSGVEPISVPEHGFGGAQTRVSPFWGSIPSFADNFPKETPVAVLSPNRQASGWWPASAQSPCAAERSLVGVGWGELELGEGPLSCGSGRLPLPGRLPWNRADLASKLGGLISAKQPKT